MKRQVTVSTLQTYCQPWTKSGGLTDQLSELHFHPKAILLMAQRSQATSIFSQQISLLLYLTYIYNTLLLLCQIYSHQNNMLWSNDGKRSIIDELLFIVMTALIYHINKSHKKRNYSPLVTKHDKHSVPAFINSGFVNVENSIMFIWHHSSL